MNWENLPSFTEIQKEFRGTIIEEIFDNDRSNENIKSKIIFLGRIILRRLEGVFEYEGFRKKFRSKSSLNEFKKKHLFNLMDDVCDGMEGLNELLTATFGSDNFTKIYPRVLKYIIESGNNFQRMQEDDHNEDF